MLINARLIVSYVLHIDTLNDYYMHSEVSVSVLEHLGFRCNT